jgi:general secretion pathway protein G
MFPRAAGVILVSLLVAIATIAAVAFVRMKRAVDVAKCERVATDTLFFRTQLEAYRRMNGSFPSTEQGLQALVEKPTESPQPAHWKKLCEEIVSDDWNTPYIYRCPGIKYPDGYDLFSAGPDRKPDTADDVWR